MLVLGGKLLLVLGGSCRPGWPPAGACDRGELTPGPEGLGRSPGELAKVLGGCAKRMIFVGPGYIGDLARRH